MSLTLVYAGMPDTERGAGVDDVHAAGEVAEHEVADQRLADGVLAAAGADDRDGPGVEERVDRRGLGAVLAACITPMAVSVGSIGNSSFSTPSSMPLTTR